MSFGISIGDFITVTQIAWGTYTALRDASDDFDGFASEVHSLYTTLVCLRDDARSPSSILQYVAPQKLAGLKDVMDNCENSLLGLQKQAKKVCLLQPRDRRQFWEKFKMAFKDKQGPRDRIAIHTASINMFLSSLTHNSLGRLELLLKSALLSSSGNFSVSSNGPRGLGKDADNTWSEIGQDLLMEGINEDHLRRFADEIKKYIRYLVHGGSLLSNTNFRLDKPSHEQHRMRDRVHAQLPVRREYEEDVKKKYLEAPAEEVLQEKQRRRMKEKEYSAPEYKLSPDYRREADERESIDIDELLNSFDELFPVDKHGLPAESIFVESSTPRLEVPGSPWPETGSGRGIESTFTDENTKRPLSRGQQSRRESNEQMMAEKRAKAIDEARARLIKYERKKEEAERAGNRATAADLQDYVIRDIRQRLDDLNATNRRTVCDASRGPIVERYSHCQVCEGGNYDLCKFCVESGVRCKGNHRLEKREWSR